jgi:hypothetical protein
LNRPAGFSSTATANTASLPAAPNGRHDQGKALAEVVAVVGVEPHAGSVAPRQDAEAVVLDCPVLLLRPVTSIRIVALYSVVVALLWLMLFLV